MNNSGKTHAYAYRRKRVHFNILFFLFAAALVLSSFSALALPADFAEAAEQPTLKVAFPESRGLNEVYPDGTYGGCVYDWLYEISKYTGWKYEFVTGDADTLVDGMLKGEYDIMGGMFISDSLNNVFDYPKYSMGYNYSLLIYRKSDPDIRSYDYTTLNDKKIGVLAKATGKINRLTKFLDFNKISYELKYYDNEEDYKRCLEAPDGPDLMLGSDIYMNDNYNVAAQFESESYYIATKKGMMQGEKKLCDILSEAMESIYSACPSFAEQLYNKYFPDKYINSINFTDSEREYISQRAPVKVAVMRERYPMVYDSDGITSGILPQCMNLIKERTGLRFEFVYADNYQGILELVSSGKADIMGQFLDNDLAAEKASLVRTAKLTAFDSVVFWNKKSVGKTGPLKMAAPEGRSIAVLNSDDTVNNYFNLTECMKAVNKGKADYIKMPIVYMEDVYFENYYPNITVVSGELGKEELTLALPRPTDVSLYSILNKAINSFTENEIANIVNQSSTRLHDTPVSFEMLFYNNPGMVLGMTFGFILLIAIILILVVFFKMRSKVMHIKLEKAEETSKAKSDFLSKMSHEIRTPMNAIIGLTNLTKMSGETTPAVSDNLDKINSSAKFLLSLLNDILDMSKIESQKMTVNASPFDLSELLAQLCNIFSVQTENKNLHFKNEFEFADKNYVGDRLRLQQILTNLLSNACKFTDAGGTVVLSVKETEVSSEKATLNFVVSDNGIGIKTEDIDRIFRAFEQTEESNSAAQGTGLGLAISSNLVSLMGGTLRVESDFGKGSKFYFEIELPVFNGELSSDNNLLAENSDGLKGMKILLAEDNDINAEIVVELLKFRNVETDRARDGQEAVDMFLNSPEGFYDIILMDINMPIKDGLIASKEIRDSGRKDAKKVYILAMTANTFKEDRDAAEKAGMNDFLSKPFDVEQLYAILNKFNTEKPDDPCEQRV